MFLEKGGLGSRLELGALVREKTSLSGPLELLRSGPCPHLSDDHSTYTHHYDAHQISELWSRCIFGIPPTPPTYTHTHMETQTPHTRALKIIGRAGGATFNLSISAPPVLFCFVPSPHLALIFNLSILPLFVLPIDCV
jgi:hypothetical protein